MVEISRLVLNRILISPLEFPLGNGDPGPDDSIEIWGLWVFNVWILHSIEEYWLLFDLIWGTLEFPFYRDSGFSTTITSEFRFPFYRHQLCFLKKQNHSMLHYTGSCCTFAFQTAAWGTSKQRQEASETNFVFAGFRPAAGNTSEKR